MKKRISPNKAKFFSSLTVGILILIVVLVLTSNVMNHALKKTEAVYIESCQQVLEGYSQSIRWCLENYHTSLNSIFNEDLFIKGDTQEIQNWLIQNEEFLSPDLCIEYYVDKNGMAYFSNGQIEDLSDRNYLTKFSSRREQFYVSDILETPFTEFPIIIMERGVFDKNGEYCGMLCGAIKVPVLHKLLEHIKIGQTGHMYLQDRTGKFISHPKEIYIGKTFTPPEEDYKMITSQAVSNTKRGSVETLDEDGDVVDLFFTSIENCGWTLGLSFKKQYWNKIYTQQADAKIIVCLIASIALLILIALEIFVMDIFYKKQLINTDYDPLTNLWTRQRFEAEAEKLIKHYKSSKFVLIESDIRGFKFLNQNYGEEEADKLISFYGKLLSGMATEYHGIIGRGFADHFYILIKITEVRKSMTIFLENMDVLNEKIKNYEIPFFPKFGLAFLMPNSKHKEITIQGLIGQASFAKSTIKDNMLTNYSIYNSKLLEQINKEHFIESIMESAIENKEFFIMYQPKISLATDKIVGAEALVRWYNKDMGLLTPDKFIPLFERNGFITKLDFYVYEQVFQFIDRQILQKKQIVPVSVNMSRNHSKPERFMHEFMKLFSKYNIPAKLIQVEILERSVMDNKTLQDITERLHKEGFTVAMDDFGSGESSLNMLTQVPVDILKFDRDFLRSSTKENGDIDSKAAKFIEILINLSKHLEKETVFEGVETQSQRDFLRNIECDQAQGFFYSKPLSEQDFLEFIKQHS